jgi:hypothetical protein
MVSAVAIDHVGARAITGSLDYTVETLDVILLVQESAGGALSGRELLAVLTPPLRFCCGIMTQVQMWDFNGMKSDLRPFRKLEPSEGHPVLALSFSPSGVHKIA